MFKGYGSGMNDESKAQIAAIKLRQQGKIVRSTGDVRLWIVNGQVMSLAELLAMAGV